VRTAKRATDFLKTSTPFMGRHSAGLEGLNLACMMNSYLPKVSVRMIVLFVASVATALSASNPWKLAVEAYHQGRFGFLERATGGH
jgi:hypothetical protein